MELDELKAAWAEHGARLEKSLAIDERLLREMMLRKVRFALAAFAFWRSVDAVIGAAAFTLLLPVVIGHHDEPRYLLIGAAVLAYLAVATAQCVRVLAASLRLDGGAPVVRLQQALERTRRVELRCFRFMLLGGAVVWLPLPVLLLEAISGAPLLQKLDLGWLLCNVLVGLALLVAGWLWSRRQLDRRDLSPFAARLRDALTSAALRRADQHLAELARFLRDEPAAK